MSDPGPASPIIMTSSKNPSVAPQSTSKWAETIPWFSTIVSLLNLTCLAWFLLENILWFRSIATSTAAPSDPYYRIYIYQMLLSVLKRMVGLYSGFALIFIGTSVAFYTLSSEIKLGGGTRGASAKLGTTSPGIVAMLLGVILIMFTIHSKDTFPPYPQGDAQQLRQPQVKPQ